MLWLGKVVIFEVLFFNLVDICFEIHDTVAHEQTGQKMTGIILINSAIQALMVLLFYLSKKYHRVSSIFNSLATLIIVVGVTERNMLDG